MSKVRLEMDADAYRLMLKLAEELHRNFEELERERLKFEEWLNTEMSPEKRVAKEDEIQKARRRRCSCGNISKKAQELGIAYDQDKWKAALKQFGHDQKSALGQAALELREGGLPDALRAFGEARVS